MDQPPTGRLNVPDADGPTARRPFLQVMFTCANAYLRVYRSSDGQRYLARCPRCGKEVRFQVGAHGTSQRQFEVTCR